MANLRSQLIADSLRFLTDKDAGFGWDVSVTNPAGQQVDLVGFTADVGMTIEPETGELVSGRRASVALPIQSLTDAGLGLPTAEPNQTRKPWVIQFQAYDESTTKVYKVVDTMPDEAMGVVVCILEDYRL